MKLNPALKSWNVAYYCISYITRTKLVLYIQKGAISPMLLQISASDISQGQNWCRVFKRCNIALCLSISLRLLYHKDKTGVVYSNSKRCSIALCLCILLHLIWRKDTTGVVYSKRCNIVLCLCILLHLIYLTTKETWHLVFVNFLVLNKITVSLYFLCLNSNYGILRSIENFVTIERAKEVSAPSVTLPPKSKFAKLNKMTEILRFSPECG